MIMIHILFIYSYRIIVIIKIVDCVLFHVPFDD